MFLILVQEERCVLFGDRVRWLGILHSHLVLGHGDPDELLRASHLGIFLSLQRCPLPFRFLKTVIDCDAGEDKDKYEDDCIHIVVLGRFWLGLGFERIWAFRVIRHRTGGQSQRVLL